MQPLHLDSKMCRRCFADKPLAQFQRNRSMKGGYSGVCKKCRAAQFYDYRKRQRENIAQAREAYQRKMDIDAPRELTPVPAHLCSALLFVIKQLR